MIDLAVVAVLYLASLGLGRPCTRLIRLRAANRPERFVVELVVGLAGVSMCMMALGLLGVLWKWTVWGLLLALALLGIWLQREWVPSTMGIGKWLRRVEGKEWLIVAALGAILFWLLVTDRPHRSVDWSVTIYNLTGTSEATDGSHPGMGSHLKVETLRSVENLVWAPQFRMVGWDWVATKEK